MKSFSFHRTLLSFLFLYFTSFIVFVKFIKILFACLDVFIYRHFANYIPQNCTFITGGGGYGTNFNRRRLARIARDLGFAHINISGMGSTWFILISFLIMLKLSFCLCLGTVRPMMDT